MTRIWTPPGLAAALAAATRFLAALEAAAAPDAGRHRADPVVLVVPPQPEQRPSAYSAVAALLSAGSRLAVRAAATVVTAMVADTQVRPSVQADPDTDHVVRTLQAGGLLTGLGEIARTAGLSAEQHAELAVTVKAAGIATGPLRGRVTGVGFRVPDPPRVTPQVIEWPPGWGPAPSHPPRPIAAAYGP